MLRIVSFSLLIILQIVIAEPPPPFCGWPPPDVTNPWKCCNFPYLFKDEDFKACGIEIHPNDDQRLRRGPPDCSKLKCLFNKYKLMKDDEEIDNNAMMEFLDKWVEANPDYKNAVEKAKEHCLISELPGPKFPCGLSKNLYCMKSIMLLDCPKWEDTDNCKKLKNHIEKCKLNFVKE
ncbi:unnamed protein product [Euphydryas editha]|uniref:Uncharacterized protein n=1 Tax=Euphydryas editha TaxID=104508 RepID=A0AAU9TGT4_EUPED|nr:unnamed protein product [Euphydryas editha]